MIARFWANDPVESTDPTDGDGDGGDSKPRCPRCGTPVLVVTGLGPTEHVATPCGCRVPGDLLECEQNGGTDTNTDASE